MTIRRVAVAQIEVMDGDVAGNLETHLEAVARAAAAEADLLLFPELSLTGYAPAMAAAGPLSFEDATWRRLEAEARGRELALLVGAPLASSGGPPRIGLLVISPAGETQIYAKRRLGSFGGAEARPQAWPDPEDLHFASGDGPPYMDLNGCRLGLAICADLGAPGHLEEIADADIVLLAASVFLIEEDHRSESARLAAFAREQDCPVLMANFAGRTGGLESAGRSRIWNRAGELVAAADHAEPALLIADL